MPVPASAVVRPEILIKPSGISLFLGSVGAVGTGRRTPKS